MRLRSRVLEDRRGESGGNPTLLEFWDGHGMAFWEHIASLECSYC